MHAVRGEWKEARKSAIPLTSLTSRLVSATVAGSIAGVNGQPEEAFDLIRDALKNDRSSVASIRVWSLTSLAEIAARLGRFPQAEEFFRSALALDPNDLYALGAYTDLLLFQRRPDEVLRRLEGRDAVDGLLLRQALAVAMQLELTAPSTNQASSSGRLRMEDRLAELRTLLQSRWDASRARGEATHQREEARFALQLMHDPARAIRLARENWRVQKEPADVKILMESAAAAGDLTTLEETRRWVEDAGLKDVTLAPFLKLEDAHR